MWFLENFKLFYLDMVYACTSIPFCCNIFFFGLFSFPYAFMSKIWKTWLDYREQLDSLMKLKWPTVNYKSVPWALHTPLCNFSGWSSVGSSLNLAPAVPVTSKEQVQETADIDMDGKSGTVREEVENAREDGELPSLVPVASVVNEAKSIPSKDSELEHSIRLTLISKSILTPTGKTKSLSFRKHDDDSDLILDSDGDLDEPAIMEPEAEHIGSDGCYVMEENSWVDYGAREFSLVLTRKVDTNDRNVKLEAKVAYIIFLCFINLFNLLRIHYSLFIADQNQHGVSS